MQEEEDRRKLQQRKAELKTVLEVRTPADRLTCMESNLNV